MNNNKNISAIDDSSKSLVTGNGALIGSGFNDPLEFLTARAALEFSPHEVYICSQDTLLFSYANSNALINLGYPMEKMRAMTPLEFLPNFSSEAFSKLLEPLSRKLEPKLTFETVHRRANGSAYPVEVHLQLFDADDTGYFVATAIDISARKKVEQKLRLTEWNLAETERLANSGSWEYDISSDTANWSGNMFRLFDVDPLLHKGLSFRDFIENLVHPNDRSPVTSAFQDALSGSKPFDIEFRVIKIDGSIRHIHSTAVTIGDENDLPIHLLGRAEDITEYRSTWDALQKNKELYHSLFENMLNGFTYCKIIFEDGLPKDFIYLSVNSAFENQTGLKNVVGKKATEVTPGIFETDPLLLEVCSRVAITRQSEHLEIFIKTLNNWFMISMYSPEADHFAALFSLITERKIAEEKLTMNEAEFRRLSMEFHTLLDAFPDSLMLLDRDLKLQWVNKAAAETIGLTSETIAEQYCYSIWHNGKTHCNKCPAINCFATGQPCDDTITRKDGSIWETRCVPLHDRFGNVENVIEINRDISDHRRLEYQLFQSQKMESIGTLAGGISHDFNNILTVISGYCQIALDQTKEFPELQHIIECIQEGADRATHLTQELLLFSRKTESNKKTVNLNETITRTEKFLKKIIGEDITFKTVPHEAPITILADEHQLGQVLINLATNSRDSMPQGGCLTITVEPFCMGRDFLLDHGYGKLGSYAMLTVTDSGKGMNEFVQKRIFEPFFTTKEIGKGTGLGLAVVYGIVKQHDGYITVQSELGSGTTFRIYLPVTTEKKTGRLYSADSKTVAGGNETILIAEDDEMVRLVVTRVLTEHGYKVIESVDGSDAVNKFYENKEIIDLLLIDLIMPKMNGKEVFDEIQKIRHGVKVIFSSGYAPESINEKLSLEDGVHLITKPISTNNLLQKVRSVLDGK